MKNKWYVYILKCKDGSLYTGITNNLERRIKKHKSGSGSKYVNAKGFLKLLNFKEFENRSKASKAEYKIKQLKRKEKIKWFK